MVSEDCIFCKIVNTPKNRLKFYNKPILESRNFVVIPALGQFVEGYLLLVTKKHYLNLACIENELLVEMIDLKKKIREFLTKLYEKPIFLEHGPISNNLHGGCCIDHAHLHIIPKDIDLSKELSNHFERFFVDPSVSLLSQIQFDAPYVYFENGSVHVYKTEIIPRQYLRQLVAKKLNYHEYWDWRRYPFYNKIKNFLDKYRKFCKTDNDEKENIFCTSS